jgi:hypothetical protein
MFAPTNHQVLAAYFVQLILGFSAGHLTSDYESTANRGCLA